ncbi:MAG: hypothetical protein U0798_14710 [Gemmataceae bacterium]
MFARKVTFEPHKITDADVDQLKKHYTDKQILEMLLSIAGNNAINRWKDGAGIPQSKSGRQFARNTEATPNRILPIETYLTPTSAQYSKCVTKVTPTRIDPKTGLPTVVSDPTRPALESREEVEKALAACRTRTPRLPLVDAAKAKELLADAASDQAPASFMNLLANFPVSGKSRLKTQVVAEEKGQLTPLLKAQVSWVIARQDRAWYATAEAKRRLKALGQTDDQIYALDGDWTSLTSAERAMLTVARNLAASPIIMTEEDATNAVKATCTRDVVQLVNYVTLRASFDRITEVAGLRAEE